MNHLIFTKTTQSRFYYYPQLQMWKCCRSIATTLASVLTVALTQRTTYSWNIPYGWSTVPSLLGTLRRWQMTIDAMFLISLMTISKIILGNIKCPRLEHMDQSDWFWQVLNEREKHIQYKLWHRMRQVAVCGYT